MAGYKVVTDAIQTEAKWWNIRSDHMAEIVKAVQAARLDSSAFFTGDPLTLAMSALSAVPESHAYESFRDWIEVSLREAVEQFHDIAIVLQRIAHDYDQAEKVIDIDLNKAYEK